MDRMAYLEQRDERRNEERYQLDLKRAATGERPAAYATGVLAQQADPTSSLYQDPNKPIGLARGGSAQARRPYLVGEKGPELMVPDQDGTVIPNRKLQMLLKKKQVIARGKGGLVKAGGEPEELNRSFGFRSGAGAPAEEVGRAASLVQAGNELGSPTSFNAGAGAPVPVEVVRGMRTTYTNPAPNMGEGGGYNPTLSQNTREFATPVQAGQAYNRGAGVGEYVPPEGPKIAAEAAAYNKRPDLVEAAAKSEAERAAGLFHNQLLSAYGTPDEKGKLTLPAYVQQHALAYAPQTTDDVGKSMSKMAPLIETAKHVDLFNNPTTRPNARAQILNSYRQDTAAAGGAVDPNVEKYILNTPVTSANVGWFKTNYQKGIMKPAVAPVRNLTTAVPPPIPGGPNNAWAKPYVLQSPTGPADETSPIPQF